MTASKVTESLSGVYNENLSLKSQEIYNRCSKP